MPNGSIGAAGDAVEGFGGRRGGVGEFERSCGGQRGEGADGGGLDEVGVGAALQGVGTAGFSAGDLERHGAGGVC